MVQSRTLYCKHIVFWECWADCAKTRGKQASGEFINMRQKWVLHISSRKRDDVGLGAGVGWDETERGAQSRRKVTSGIRTAMTYSLWEASHTA